MAKKTKLESIIRLTLDRGEANTAIDLLRLAGFTHRAARQELARYQQRD